MRKLNSWLLMPLLALSTILMTSAMGGVTSSGQQQAIALETTPVEKLAAMEAFHDREALYGNREQNRRYDSRPTQILDSGHASQFQMPSISLKAP